MSPVLADLAASRRALTHEALDELPDSPPLAHLHQVLVGVGALPERDGYLVRLPQSQARSPALFQLATEIPWRRLSAGDWVTYANEVSRRTATENR